jgi:hypothetical protein
MNTLGWLLTRAGLCSGLVLAMGPVLGGRLYWSELAMCGERATPSGRLVIILQRPVLYSES